MELPFIISKFMHNLIFCTYIVQIQKGQDMMDQFQYVLRCFPMEIQSQIYTLDDVLMKNLEEIRVYKNKQVQIFFKGRHMQLKGIVHGNEMEQILQRLLQFSYYAFEEDLAKGFVTIEGGHRVGVCGKAVVEKGKVVLLRDISSFNIRYAKEIPGCSNSVMGMILDQNQIQNTLIVSPPGCGKTTLLRDIARNLTFLNYKVAICDERSEIAGMHQGISPFQFGPMADILDGCPKAEGIMMLIRSMSPHVIIADEIGMAADFDAVRTCVRCGVSVITSIHGSDYDDLKKHKFFSCMDEGIFSNIIFLTDKPHIGTIREVYHV